MQSATVQVAAVLVALAIWSPVVHAQPLLALPPLDGLEHAVADHLREAHRELDAAVKTFRGRQLAEAYGAFGRVVHAYEFSEPAEAAYLNAIRLAAGEPKWRHLLGHLYQQTGRIDDAAEQFGSARRLNPDDRLAAARLADVYLGLDRLRDARELFEEIAATFPAVAQNGLGEVALREGRFRDAVRHFEAVLERVPQAAAVHYPLAMAYRGLGQFDDAQAHLEKRGAGGVRIGDPLVDSLPALVRGERGLIVQGRRAFDAGQFEEAADAFRRALAAEPDSLEARARLAAALERLGQHDTARAEVIKAEDSLLGRAIALADRERFSAAIELLERGHQLFPGAARTATTLARMLAASPDHSLREGTRALGIAMRVYADSPAPVHAETVALALAELERCGEATEWMQRAIAAAEQEGNAAEIARLRGERSNYSAASCRR